MNRTCVVVEYIDINHILNLLRVYYILYYPTALTYKPCSFFTPERDDL